MKIRRFPFTPFTLGAEHFSCHVFQTFESVDEILKCHDSELKQTCSKSFVFNNDDYRVEIRDDTCVRVQREIFLHARDASQ